MEWVTCATQEFQWRIAPVTLTFHDVVFPQVAVDYEATSAAFGPFSMDGIERRTGPGNQIWTLPISWPGGEIEFQANGFTQRAVGETVETLQQCLTPAQRGPTVTSRTVVEILSVAWYGAGGVCIVRKRS